MTRSCRLTWSTCGECSTVCSSSPCGSTVCQYPTPTPFPPSDVPFIPPHVSAAAPPHVAQRAVQVVQLTLLLWAASIPCRESRLESDAARQLAAAAASVMPGEWCGREQQKNKSTYIIDGRMREVRGWGRGHRWPALRCVAASTQSFVHAFVPRCALWFLDTCLHPSPLPRSQTNSLGVWECCDSCAGRLRRCARNRVIRWVGGARVPAQAQGAGRDALAIPAVWCQRGAPQRPLAGAPPPLSHTCGAALLPPLVPPSPPATVASPSPWRCSARGGRGGPCAAPASPRSAPWCAPTRGQPSRTQRR